MKISPQPAGKHPTHASQSNEKARAGVSSEFTDLLNSSLSNAGQIRTETGTKPQAPTAPQASLHKTAADQASSDSFYQTLTSRPTEPASPNSSITNQAAAPKSAPEMKVSSESPTESSIKTKTGEPAESQSKTGDDKTMTSTDNQTGTLVSNINPVLTSQAIIPSVSDSSAPTQQKTIDNVSAQTGANPQLFDKPSVDKAGTASGKDGFAAAIKANPDLLGLKVTVTDIVIANPALQNAITRLAQDASGSANPELKDQAFAVNDSGADAAAKAGDLKSSAIASPAQSDQAGLPTNAGSQSDASSSNDTNPNNGPQIVAESIKSLATPPTVEISIDKHRSANDISSAPTAPSAPTSSNSTPVTVDGVKFAPAVDAPQIIEQIASAINPKLTELKLLLRPANLGLLQVQLTTNAGRVTAMITTESQAVKDALEQHLPQLQASLAEHGIKAGEITISAHVSSAPDMFMQFGQNHSSHQPPTTAPKTTGLARTATVNVEPLTMPIEAAPSSANSLNVIA